MSEVLDRAKALRQTAKSRTASADRRKSRGGEADYSEPVEILGEAIDLLLGEMERAEAGGGDEAGAEVSPGDVAGALADCYGMLGGVHRRAGALDSSIAAYDEGEKYERNPAYNVQNSYNITNAIAVRVLKDPRSLAALRGRIAEAIELIGKQVDAQANGQRSKQWWAWADLGELRLLAGKSGEAREAYVKFRECGPRALDYDSTVSVLDELAEVLKGADEEVASAIASAARSLNESKPSV
jgi:tetratricopeptide (TPR) repeat protein